MPAKSKSQQRLFGMVTAYKEGKLKLDDLPVSLAKKIKSIADGSKKKTGDKRKKTKGITKKAASDYASTKHKGLPEKVKESQVKRLSDFLNEEKSETHPLDDLKANFRSWEQDCDNEEVANSLYHILASRHPGEDEEELKSLAYDWVGYEDEDDNRNYLRDTIYHGRSEIPDELIDDFDTSRNPDEFEDEEIEECVNTKKVLKFNETNLGEKHHPQIEEEVEELNKKDGKLKEGIIHFTKFESVNENLNKFVGTPGDTEIWYMKETNFDSWDFREEMYKEEPNHNMEYTKRNGPRIDPKNLEKTHALLGTVGETDLDEIYHMMNNWGVGKLSNDFLEERGVTHTSMSVGDIIKIGDTIWFVDGRGFKDITNE